MEFENVNNYNIAIEARDAKMKRSSAVRRRVFSSASAFIKKLLRRAKSDCCAGFAASSKSEEEMDNDINEQLEAKATSKRLEGDMRCFSQVTYWQTPSAQVPSN